MLLETAVIGTPTDNAVTAPAATGKAVTAPAATGKAVTG